MSGREGFGAYLRGRYRPSTRWAYERQVERYVRWCGGEVAAAAAGYGDVLAYLAQLRGAGLAARSVHAALGAVRAYYAWLAAVGVRADHPCRTLELADRVDRAIRTDILPTPAEVAAWVARSTAERMEHRRRAAVACQLVGYQAATTGEVAALRVGDVDLQAGTVRLGVPGARTLARELPLRASQAVLLARYLAEDHPRYVAEARARGHPDDGRVFLSRRGGPLLARHVTRVVNGGRPESERLAPRVVRQGVIAGLLAAGHAVRVVQAFAGHRTAEATAAYGVAAAEALAAAIARGHPRG